MEKRKTRTGLLLATPILLGLVVFYIVPFFISVWYSVTFGVGGVEFVGLDNYVRVFGSTTFRLAAWNTVRFIGIGVPLIMLASLLLAILLQKKFAGTKLFRSTLLFPMVVPVASTVMFIQIFFADRGIVNMWLERLGLPIESWLNSDRAFGVLVGLYIWKNLGYNVILMLAGLNMISRELYEMAQIEGASARKQFTRITLPLMVPSLFFVFVMSIINAFKSFREAFAIGGKYPHDSIYMLQHFLNNNFDNLNYQRLSVAAFMVFLVIFILVGALFTVQNRFGKDNL